MLFLFSSSVFQRFPYSRKSILTSFSSLYDSLTPSSRTMCTSAVSFREFPSTSLSDMTPELLLRKDDTSSSAVLSMLENDSLFKMMAKKEGVNIMQRDAADDEKLARGIQRSVQKNLLPVCSPPTARPIDVHGRSAYEVAKEIVGCLSKKEGNIIVLQGLSGTGKGTTVDKLRSMLPKCVAWSNGNVFRCYTYLVLETLEKLGKNISTEVLVDDPSILKDAVDRVKFKMDSDTEYDIVIDGTTGVKSVENTLLKTTQVSKAVPIVAELTQGEVILLGQDAASKLSSAGFNIILEGRAQTLQYIETKNRFELKVPDITLLGERRVAQIVIARALQLMQVTPVMSVDEAVQHALQLVRKEYE